MQFDPSKTQWSVVSYGIITPENSDRYVAIRESKEVCRVLVHYFWYCANTHKLV